MDADEELSQGESLVRAKRENEAIPHFLRAVAAAPQGTMVHVTALGKLAATLLATGRKREAIEHLLTLKRELEKGKSADMYVETLQMSGSVLRELNEDELAWTMRLTEFAVSQKVDVPRLMMEVTRRCVPATAREWICRHRVVRRHFRTGTDRAELLESVFSKLLFQEYGKDDLWTTYDLSPAQRSQVAQALIPCAKALAAGLAKDEVDVFRRKIVALLDGVIEGDDEQSVLGVVTMHDDARADGVECAFCQARMDNLKKCGRCKCVSYCCVLHSALAWPSHKTVCK